MKIKLLCILGLLTTLLVPTAFAQGTAFTYQGRLNDGNGPANGNHEVPIHPCSTTSTGGQTFAKLPVVGDVALIITIDTAAPRRFYRLQKP